MNFDQVFGEIFIKYINYMLSLTPQQRNKLTGWIKLKDILSTHGYWNHRRNLKTDLGCKEVAF